jgi:hypothetical protein
MSTSAKGCLVLSLLAGAGGASAAVWVVPPSVRFDMPYRSATAQQIVSSATGGVFIDDAGVRQTAGYGMSSTGLCCIGTSPRYWQVSYSITNTGTAPFDFVTSAEFPQFGIVMPGQSKSFDGIAEEVFAGGMGGSFSVHWNGLSAPWAMISAAGLIPEPGTLALLSLGIAAVAGAARRQRRQGTMQSAG